MSSLLNIDVLISTCGDRVYNLNSLIHSYKDNVRYIICHQNFESYPPAESLVGRIDVKYIPSCTLGVTKSRNILLQESEGDIVYFCDDDIILSHDFELALFDSHSKYLDEVILFNIKDEFGNLRKNYPCDTVKKNRFSILSVGTIEISLKKSAVSPLFPEDIGAGTDLPVGDEAIFLSKLLRKGFSIRYFPYTIGLHPKESTGLNVTRKSIYSRGVTLRRVYGFFMSLPLAVVFLVRRRQLFKIKEGCIKATLIFLNGVFRGK